MKRTSSATGITARHRTPKEKAEILREHRHSGLSLLAFARKEGLCYGSLLRWRSRRARGASLLESCQEGADPGFVPVKLERDGAGGEYILSWATGRSLKIPAQFETGSLRRLLRVLEGLR